MLSFLKTNSKISTVLVYGLVLLFVFPCAAFGKKQALYIGEVTSFKLNIRKGPSQSADVIMAIDRGTKVDVIEKKGGIGSWLTVRYQGTKGYIRNRPHNIKLIKVVKKKPPVKKPVAKKKAVKEKPVAKVPTPKKSRKKPSGEDRQLESLKKEARIIEQKQVEHKKQKIEEKLATETRKVESFSKKEMEMIEGLNEIDFALNKARISASKLSDEVKKLEEKTRITNEKKEVLAKSIVKNQGYVGKRLDALYRMNMIGRIELAGLPSSVFDFFLKQNAMKRVIATDFDVLSQQNGDLEEFEKLEAMFSKEMDEKLDLENELKLQIRIKEIEGQKKAAILREIRNKKALSLAAVASLKEASERLENRFLGMTKEVVITPEKIEGSFIDAKGRLPRPARGKIISWFGPSRTGDYKSFTFQSGIDIRVDRGEPVSSVFKGTVMFAEWLKGYGNLLIVNHGDNYYTLYAHLEEIFKKKGEKVETGEVIATAGDTGSIKGLCLHFEVRHHGKPVNPMNWLKRGA